MLHLADGDESTDWTLLLFLDSLLRQLDLVEQLSRDTDDYPGWAKIVDIDTVPAEALGWLAQFIGVTLPTGLSEEAQRIRITEAAGWKRGSLSAIQGAARLSLTGTRRVDIFEQDGSPYHFRVRTYLSETPNPSQVVADVQALKPAGLTFEHEVQAGLMWEETTGTWAAPDIVAWEDGTDIVPT
ncbi:MAG: phage tail protein [Dermatophilaceae bacterium]|nr:phage tail protein [Intrasporangiaceae bacterium]